MKNGIHFNQGEKYKLAMLKQCSLTVKEPAQLYFVFVLVLAGPRSGNAPLSFV